MGKRIVTAAIALSILLAPAASMAGYRWELKKQTERGRIYHVHTWDAELIWYATFFNEKFRDEFIKQHEKIKHAHGVEAARFEAEQMNRQLDGWDFFVALYTKDEYKEFSQYEDSFWQIELTTGSGQVVEPMLIERLPITPYEKKMFPYIDRWSRGYRVTFPKVSLGDEIKLTIKSVVGSSTLEWKVK